MISLDAAELTELSKTAEGATKATFAQAVRAVKSASFAVERRVKEDMPVDTGRARASWGHWDGSAGEAGDGHWEESDNGLTIEQGTNVDYVPFLNAGSSRQAPAGFIDRAEAKGQYELEKALGLIDPLSAEGLAAFAETISPSGFF